MKTIGIIGSRRRKSDTDYKQLEKKFFEIYEEDDEIVSGGCYCGGDRFGEIIAKKFQIPIKIYYAQWDKLGTPAGFIRNAFIARDADVLIALVASDRTGGAENTINTARKLGKKIVILTDEPTSESNMPPSNTPNTYTNDDIDNILL